MLRLPELQPAFDGIPALADGQVLRELAGGPVSDTWLAAAGGQQVVVRIDKPLARQIGLDRQRELQVLETVAAAGIGPQPIWADPVAGLLVTVYIPGAVWSAADAFDQRKLQALAEVLRRLHALPVNVSGLDPARAAVRYARRVGGLAAAECAVKAVRLADQLLAGDSPQALCHNDLVHTNIIDVRPLRLIDWEYAAAGDPLFDLAVVVRHHRLPAASADYLLRACLGRIDGATAERISAFCELYDILSDLWYRSTNK
jgi:thiamine kinase